MSDGTVLRVAVLQSLVFLSSCEAHPHIDLVCPCSCISYTVAQYHMPNGPACRAHTLMRRLLSPLRVSLTPLPGKAKQCGCLLIAEIIARCPLAVIHTHFQGTLANLVERTNPVHRLKLFVLPDRQTAGGEKTRSWTTGPYHRRGRRRDA